jgi:hypothetical protein
VHLSPHDTKMSQRCPNPECMTIIDQANAFVLARLAGLCLDPYVSLRDTDEYQQLMDTLIDALAAGDLEQTKVVCRAWIRLTVAWIVRNQPEASAQSTPPAQEEIR